MLGGVTRHMLPHLPEVPHLHVKRPLVNIFVTLSDVLKWQSQLPAFYNVTFDLHVNWIFIIKLPLWFTNIVQKCQEKMYVVISFSPLPQKIQCSSLFFAPEWTTLTQGLDEWRVYNDIGVLCVSKCKILNTFCPISLPYKYKNYH